MTKIPKPARDADEDTILTYLHMEQGVPVHALQGELAAFQQGLEVPKWMCRHGVARHWCAECRPTPDAGIVTGRDRQERGRGT